MTLDGARMGAIIDAALGWHDQLALARLEVAFGDSFGGSVSLFEIDQLDMLR